jgi:hypothetical protein
MPLINADILDHCAKTGRPVADVLCHCVEPGGADGKP